ncbi:unnamed protein product [Lactuca saligna]|uniref:Helicase C-terminal domain-containing protein n=1 Tax=Lactuca saligna TaxID=75948 RepID=A0AA36DZI5_LACSI|nr:unnamed protein product [Lactuca saligna]
MLITESFHSQLGLRLLHRTSDYDCDSSTTPVTASRLTSLASTLIASSFQLDFSFQLEIDIFIPYTQSRVKTIVVVVAKSKCGFEPLWRNQNPVDEAIEDGATPMPLSLNKTLDVHCMIDVMDHMLACEVLLALDKIEQNVELTYEVRSRIRSNLGDVELAAVQCGSGNAIGNKESNARHASKYLKQFPFNTFNGESEYPDIASAIDALRKSPAGLYLVLSETLSSGVDYHHASLTIEEREIVEKCYRKGLVHVLTATSTIAARVNLPTRRFIFRQPCIGRYFLDGIRYIQISGRTCCIGIDTKGESVGDQNRGYLLELMLTKLWYGAGEGRVEFSKRESSGLSCGKSNPTHGLQIVGMSATSPNVNEVVD